MKYDIKGQDDESLTGFSAGYSQTFSLSQTLPIFIEAGLGLQYTNFSKSLSGYDDDYRSRSYYDDYDYDYDYDEDSELKFTMWSVKVPVSLLYNFAIPNSSISLAPFVGATMRYNVSGTIKKGGNKQDVFDKKDMGEAWNRFQIGWQVGLKARFGQNFMAGVSYGSDFSEIDKKTKLQTTSITIGYTF